jgi:hypothetical protein
MFVFDYPKHFIACEMSGKEDTVRLTLDKHESHLSISVIIVAKENDISLLALPPHTSHRVRPLDCTNFGPYGTYDNASLNDWILSNPGKMQQSTVLQSLLENVSARHLSNITLKRGFM